MIEPDNRESLWYDLNNLLMIDSNIAEHYWSILLDKLRIIDNNKPRLICKTCNSIDLFEFEKNLYCLDEYEPIVKDKKIIKVKRITKDEKNHIVADETITETIQRLLKSVINHLEEPSGNKMTLFALESWMFRQPEDNFFETRLYGDVTKNQVNEMLYNIKQIALDYMTELKGEIRFSATLRVPPIQFR